MTKAEHMPDEIRLRELLVGKKIVSAVIRNEMPEPYTSGPFGLLTLSDGLVLKVWGNDGGCSCDAGCYPLETLNGCDNMITNVEVEERADDESHPCPDCGKKYCEHGGWYRIFVYADNEKINLASFEGSDGNGYYGTGWWLTVADEVSP